MVRVAVAIGALAECKADVLRLTIGSVDVTFGALHLLVKAGQGILCFRVIKLPDIDRLPVLIVVALNAVLTEAASMLILVTAYAGGRKSKITSIEIGVLNGGAFWRRNVCDIVALVAINSGVSAL